MALLLKATDVPEYCREYCISTGYRQTTLSYKTCLHSLFRLHNETVNIWTHLLGFIILLFLLCSNVLNPPRDEAHMAITPIVVQLISYQICLLSSTLFHTFSCLTESVRNSWLRFDHFGVLCALFGTYIPLICDTFGCFPTWRNFHLLITVLLFSTAAFLNCIVFADRIKINLEIYLALGLYCTIPFCHWIFLKGGLTDDVVQDRLHTFVTSYCILSVGLVFYLSRFPENTFTSSFVDIWGHSHQLWHISVVAGMFHWYFKFEPMMTKEFVCQHEDHHRDLDIYGVSSMLWNSSFG